MSNENFFIDILRKRLEKIQNCDVYNILFEKECFILNCSCSINLYLQISVI